MTPTEPQIALWVEEAKTNSQAADRFIQQYLGFIKSELAKFLHTSPDFGHEDELSIAMFAFYEAILGYQRGRGAFLPYASRAIKNRLIDYYRREKRHERQISLNQPYGDEEEGGELLHILPEEKNPLEESVHREATQAEIEEFRCQLEQFGIHFSAVADNSPRQQRTLNACQRALSFARENPELLEQLLRTKKLPLKELAQGAGVERKTLERHRDYLMAILLAFTNGYEIIRGHLCRLYPAEKGGEP